MDFRIQLIPVPVSDVDRALAFYTENAGFTLDMDHVVQEGLRFVQLTPPGSACSIAIGEGLTDKPPGSAAIQVVQTFPWGSFVFFTDPDGNAWSVQQLPPRPGR